MTATTTEMSDAVEGKKSGRFDTEKPDWEKVDKLRFTFFQSIYTVVECAFLHPLTVAQVVAEMDKVKLSKSLDWKERIVQSFKNNLSIGESFRKISNSSKFTTNLRVGFTAFPITCAYYQMYDMISFLPYMKLNQTLEKELPHSLQSLSPALAGMATAIPVLLIGTPLNIIARYQIKLRCEAQAHSSVLDTVKYMYNQTDEHNRPYKWRSFTRGIIGNTFSIPLMGLGWLIYENTLERIQKSVGSTNIATAFAAGSFSGVVTSVLWRPVGVVITRKQIQPEGYRKIVHDIVKEEGVGALWKGLTARVLASAPRTGIFFSCYSIFATWAMKNSME